MTEAVCETCSARAIVEKCSSPIFRLRVYSYLGMGFITTNDGVALTEAGGALGFLRRSSQFR